MRRELTWPGWRQVSVGEPGVECVKMVMLASALNRLDGYVQPSACKLWQERYQVVKPHRFPAKTYHSFWALLSRRR